MPSIVKVRRLLTSEGLPERSPGAGTFLCSIRVNGNTCKTSLSCKLTMSALCCALIKSFLKACSRMIIATLYPVGRTGNSRMKTWWWSGFMEWNPYPLRLVGYDTDRSRRLSTEQHGTRNKRKKPGGSDDIKFKPEQMKSQCAHPWGYRRQEGDSGGCWAPGNVLALPGFWPRSPRVTELGLYWFTRFFNKI